MFKDNKVWIGKSDKRIYLEPKMANRHGLVAGATGTGKTITLKVMAESFSEMGVPVFLADIKGDLASLASPGTDSENMQERIKRLEIDNFTYKSFPVQFWDIYGENGLPLRTTISEMGPILLSRILDLNDTQSGILNIVFRVADENGLLLLDLKDLRSMVQYVGDNAKELTLKYGNIAAQSVGAILRALMVLEDQGGNFFFGEPELDFNDWMKVAGDGRGYINILHSSKLFLNPALYSTFLLWMLSELFENLPEEGDLEQPKMVFFFDEAHLLFDNAPKVLLNKIEQVVRLIRSKGVGVYFVTQNPRDLPDEILGQLGNRIQHALRAYTPADRKKVVIAAETFRTNPEFDTVQAITELETGEALISCLDEKGSPCIVERSFILPPQSKFGTIDDYLRKQTITSSPLYYKYDKEIDRESAYEMLIKRNEREMEELKLQKERLELEKIKAKEAKELEKLRNKKSNRLTPVERVTNSAMSAIGREIGRSLIRGVLGSLRR
ncbi:helicase HerA-like domain-containing protein [Sedimentibacter sp.]|uniref:helicase HerA-like domain-containing protein n=1 Tax=Sedimentibacter sp. TaxID=1960295 RepID=UPI0028972056|nr:helicase HerA-like domain-containing protein [Sedimentibacter sp.]